MVAYSTIVMRGASLAKIMPWQCGCVTSKSTSVTPDGAVTAFHFVGTNEVALVMCFGRFIFVGSAAEWMFNGPCRQSAVQLSHRIYMAYNNGITILPSVGLCMDYRCDSARNYRLSHDTAMSFWINSNSIEHDLDY